MKIINEYPTHHYVRNWEKTEWFCPECGKPAVWQEQGGGDYYVGCELICVHCGVGFYMPDETHDAKSDILEQLRSGVTATPTTPSGR